MRNLTPEQLDKAVGEAIKKYMPMSPNSKGSNASHRQLMEERRKDHISHFILRLAYSRRFDATHCSSKSLNDPIRLHIATTTHILLLLLNLNI
jgi:hypothetical protein